MWWAIEDIWNRLFETKARLAECTGSHQHPDNLNRRKLEDGNASAILKGQARKERHHEANVGRQHVQDELLDIVKDATTLLDGVENRGKIVVSENNVCRFLCNVRPRPHRNAHVCTLQTGTVVDAVARHGHIALPSMQRLNHAHFRARRTACHNQGQLRQRVDLAVRQRIKVVRRHHHRLSDVGGQQPLLVDGRQDPHLPGDGARRLRVVAREHVHDDARALARLHAGQRLGARRVVDADQAAEDEVALEAVSAEHRRGPCDVGFRDGALVDLVREGEDAEALAGEGFHVEVDVLADLARQGLDGVVHGNGVTAGQDSFDGALQRGQKRVLH